MLSVRDLLADIEVNILCGEAGLDLPVRWVHISKLTDPTPWLSGGEVLLTTGIQLQTPQVQREFVERLSDHHLAALGFGTGFTHATVPAPILELAAERSFPVFDVPYEVPFIAITEAAFTHLVNEQYAILRRASAAQERLERIVLSERGLDEVAGALSALIGGAVLVFDPRGELLAQRAFARPVGPEQIGALSEELRERGRRRDARTFMPGSEDASSRLALPVAADGSAGGSGAGAGRAGQIPEAWLVAIKDSGPLSEFDRLTLRQAVTIVALELLRARVAGDTERRLAGDVLAGVVSGELAGTELQRRLEPFGLSERVAALAFTRPGGGRGAAATGENVISQALREEAASGLVASTGALTCAFVSGMAEEELFAFAERIAAGVRAELGNDVVIGVGRAVSGTDARRSFHEARCTLEALALRVGGGENGAVANGNGNGQNGAVPAIATYKELGAFQLLLSLQDDEALKLFCDSILGPIEASEGHYGGELMRSLEAFIEENGQWERAAKRLYCHRHTLRYRIKRVEELTGRNLQSARDRIEFWLALRGRELVK